MTRKYTDWIAPLQEEVGNDLRMAAQYTEEEYEHLFLHDDVKPKYTQGELENLRHEKVALTLTKNRIERIANAGNCQYFTFRLDDAFIFVFPKTLHAGRFVSVEPDAAVENTDIIEICAF